MYEVDQDADLHSIDELETIEFHWLTFDGDNYNTITSDIPATVNFK